MAIRYKTTKKRIPKRRLISKKAIKSYFGLGEIISGVVEINLGADDFCYIHTKNHRRVDLTQWMKKFGGKDVVIEVRKCLKEVQNR